MISALLNAKWAKISAASMAALIIAFFSGWDKGASSERNKRIIVANSEAEAHRIANDKILEQRELALIQLTLDNAQLLQKVEQDEKIINRTNRITNRFVRDSSSLLPEAASSITTESAESNDDAAISKPSRIVEYNIQLLTAYEYCRVQQNALVDSIM
jgi:hypothetical protein